MPAQTDVGQFLIAGQAPVLGPLFDLLTVDPATEILSVSRGPQGELRRLVVSMEPTRASALGTALAGSIEVEPDVDVPPP